MQILKLISSSSSTLDCKNWSFGKLKNKARLKKSHLKMQIAKLKINSNLAPPKNYDSVGLLGLGYGSNARQTT
jgi:hypothetical protein